MGRAPCCSKVGLHRGPWTDREDMLLTKFIESNGEGQWRALPKKAGLLRCGKSCRLRWMNYLRPDIKRGNITPDEEELVIRLHKLLGNRWSLIAGRLPGRTDNEIKNFWNTHLSKKLARKGINPKTHQPLPNKQEARASTDEVKNDEYPIRKKKSIESDCKQINGGTKKGHVQPIHLPKANRFIAFTRSSSNPILPSIRDLSNNALESHANDALLLPSIDLNSPFSMSSLNSTQDNSDYSCYLNSVDNHDPQSVLAEQDCFPWPYIVEEEDWNVSNFQPAEEEEASMNPNSSLQLHDENNAERITTEAISLNSNVPSDQTKIASRQTDKPQNCSNIMLQEVYDEYLELLQDNPSPNNNHGHEDNINVFSEGGLSSLWDCLQGDDDQLVNNA